ncbi:MAG TPA: cupin domain-containing protein [Bryobacteraceae bacterium]|nr:cupin domain-containing protein [Bryobacteraceae bacterium]
MMKLRYIALMLALPLIAAEPAGYKYWSAAELKAFDHTLAPKINAQKVALERLSDFGNHYTMVAHREGSGEAEFHEHEVDIFLVTSGTGTLIVGGTMPNAKITAPGEMRAPSIDGGSKQKLSAGDVVHIPVKTAHQIILDPGAKFTYFVVKVKE